MLDYLLPDFEHHPLADAETVEAILEHEARAIVDIPFLEEHVTGVADFAWDYRSLDEGFMQLIGPYLSLRSGAGHLYAALLHVLEADRDQLMKGLLLLDFPLMGNFVNDTYISHPALTPRDTDRRICSKLTQFRYAGQYLSKYPGYLLVENTLSLSPQALERAHKVGAGTYTVSGIGRTQFLKSFEPDAAPLSKDAYFQMAVNNLHGPVLAPVQLALNLTDREPAETRQALKAFSHLAVCLKLLAEQNVLERRAGLPDTEEAQGTARFHLLPGRVLLDEGGWAQTLQNDQAHPDLHRGYTEVVDQARSLWTPEQKRALTAEARHHFTTFTTELADLPWAPPLIEALTTHLPCQEDLTA